MLASACVGTRETVAIVTGGELPAARPVWVIGVAGNAKLGAVVTAGEHVVYCEGRAAWPPEQDGKPVVIAGTLTTRTLPPPPVGPHGERSAGAEGAMSTLSPCAFPPEHDGGGLIEAERALFAALARRDRSARAAGRSRARAADPRPADADRAALLQGIAAAPGDILEVTGEQLRAHDAGDTGIDRSAPLAAELAGVDQGGADPRAAELAGVDQGGDLELGRGDAAFATELGDRRGAEFFGGASESAPAEREVETCCGSDRRGGGRLYR